MDLKQALDSEDSSLLGESERASFGNPVFSGYFADPFVFRSGDDYFAVGTGDPMPAKRGEATRFPMLWSSDFETWVPIGNALLQPDVEGEQFWAPEVAFLGGTFFLYYSVGSNELNHQLRVATSTSPAGPYRDLGEPLLDPASTPFAIDPHPFKDDNGSWYLFYARNLLDNNRRRPGTAVVVTPLTNMTSISTDFQVVAEASQDWQRFQSNRTMYGERFDWHTLEGPCVVKRANRYYCMYSGGNWQKSNYGIDFVVSDNPIGPYLDSSVPAGPRVLSTIPEKVIGPGHNSVVSGPDGQTEYLAYHAWDPRMSKRRLFLDRLVWNAEGPVCLGPTWSDQFPCFS